VTVVTDPVYLEEPMVKTQEFTLDLQVGYETRGQNMLVNWLYPCEYVEEAPGRAQGWVPSFLPGENPFVEEFARGAGVPLEAALGGAATMYPEYRDKLR